MSDSAVSGYHPLAAEHLPMFVQARGGTDVLLVAMAVFMVAAVIGIGVFYFKLHSLPEQMAHRGQKVQFEIVAVLGLLSLFTHNNLFWIAALLLAFVPMPDFLTPLTSMAQSLGKIAGGSAQPPAGGHAAPMGTAGGPPDAEQTPGGIAQVPPDGHKPTAPQES